MAGIFDRIQPDPDDYVMQDNRISAELLLNVMFFVRTDDLTKVEGRDIINAKLIEGKENPIPLRPEDIADLEVLFDLLYNQGNSTNALVFWHRTRGVIIGWEARIHDEAWGRNVLGWAAP